jgi:hypothetical protein
VDNEIFKGGEKRANGTLEKVERELILETLRRNKWNRSHTADELGISVRNLRNKICQYKAMGIEIANSKSNGGIRNKYGKLFKIYQDVVPDADRPAIKRFWDWTIEREKARAKELSDKQRKEYRKKFPREE